MDIWCCAIHLGFDAGQSGKRHSREYPSKRRMVLGCGVETLLVQACFLVLEQRNQRMKPYLFES
jgi:hypothetical protein